MNRFLLRLLPVVALTVLLLAACSRDPNARKQKFLVQGNQEFDQGKYADAMIYYGRALQIDPRFPDTHYKLAQTYMRTGSWASAYQELLRTVDLQPENWAAQLDLGKLQLAGGKPRDAKDRALLLLKSKQNDADAKMLLSDADVALGNLNDAIREANDAIAIAPDRAMLYLNLGHIQARMNDFPAAEQSFRKATALDPNSVMALLTLGKFYQQQKNWVDAEKCFKAAIDKTPKDVSARAALAALYFNQGQTNQAEEVLRQAKQQLSGDPNAYRLLADSYLARGQSEKALTELAELAGKYPNDLSVRKSYAQLLLLGNRAGEAKNQVQQILQKSPQDPEALILRGQLELRENQLEQAITTLQSALKSAPENAIGHYQLGLAYKQKGNAEQAESEWREAVRLRPNMTEAWVALGMSATQRADWRGLEQISNELRKNSPHSVEGYLFHATARFNQGDAAGAEADLKRLAEAAPDQPLPYIKLGQLRLSQKRFDEAGNYFRQALAHDANSIEAIRGVVDVDLAKSKGADTLKFLQEQITRNPGSSALYLMQGDTLLRMKQNDAAAAALTHAVELDRSNLGALVLLAQTQTSLNQVDQAIRNYQKAIEMSPRDPRLLIAIGGLYERSGNWQRAEESYQKALSLKPDDPFASNNLAYLLLEHNGDKTVALSLAQAARKGLPNLPNSADTLGWAYFHNRAYSAAAPLFEEAVKATPNNQTYRYHLGLTYQKLQDSARAKVELEKAISIDPKSPLAEQARQAIGEKPAS